MQLGNVWLYTDFLALEVRASITVRHTNLHLPVFTAKYSCSSALRFAYQSLVQQALLDGVRAEPSQLG